MEKRKILLIIVVAILILGVTTIYFQNMSTAYDSYEVNLHVKTLYNFKSANHSEKKKTILLWTSMFGDDWFHFENIDHFGGCPKRNNCVMTRDRELVDIDKFDAVFFHGNEVNHTQIPPKRSPMQKFVFVNIESPRNRPLPDKYFENYFNMTMTYRLDSDIYWPHYIVWNITTGEMVAPLKDVKWIEPSYDRPDQWKPVKNFKKKDKIAAWLVSNCETWGRREFFVNELEKVARVDRIGKCVKEVVPNCMDTADICFKEVIEPQYFFYLSFENSLCEDYVTEKFFNALSHDVVPVVYGGADYSLFAPPHSYIDALDFDSPKALGNYLTELSNNKEEYLKYFWWRRFYTVTESANWTLCNLCEILHERRKPKTYSLLTDWYSKNKCPMQNFMNGREHATKKLRSRVSKKS